MCHTPLLVHLLMQEDFQTVSEYVRRRETLHKFEGQLLHTHMMVAQTPNNTAHRSTTPAASTHSLSTHYPQEYYTCSINTLTSTSCAAPFVRCKDLLYCTLQWPEETNTHSYTCSLNSHTPTGECMCVCVCVCVCACVCLCVSEYSGHSTHSCHSEHYTAVSG